METAVENTMAAAIARKFRGETDPDDLRRWGEQHELYRLFRVRWYAERGRSTPPDRLKDDELEALERALPDTVKAMQAVILANRPDLAKGN